MVEEGESDRTRRELALDRFYGPLADSTQAARRVGWESAEAQRMRLCGLVEAAAGVAPPGEARSVLDAGCGEGELLPLLRAAGFAGTYRGEDLRSAPITRARGRFSADPAARFEVADAFARDGVRAELVVCSGALNTDAGRPDHQAEVEAAVSALFGRAERGLVFDIAIADRHHPGVGLAAVDVLALYAFCRSLTPICSVREDTVAGEAIFCLARSRAAAFAGRTGDAALIAENLLMAGEPGAALAVLGRAAAGEAARVALIRGRALAATGRHRDAMASLELAAQGGEGEGAGEGRGTRLAVAARLAMAPLLWRAGRKAEAEQLLVGLAEVDDEARAHLAELHLARGRRQEAAAVVERIEDPWMKRELRRVIREAGGGRESGGGGETR